MDLVQFDKRIGGLNRVATVLNELAESIKPEQITESILQAVPVAAIQRLGFLLDVILKQDISKYLYDMSQKAELKFFCIPLLLPFLLEFLYFLGQHCDDQGGAEVPLF